DAGAAGLPRIARPRFIPGLAFRRDGVRPPELLAGPGVERADEPADAEIAARDADDDLVFDDDGCVRDRELLDRLVADFFDGVIPDDLAGLRVDRHQVRVDRAHVERVAQDRQAAADAAAARARLEHRLVFQRPERTSARRVERDD